MLRCVPVAVWNAYRARVHTTEAAAAASESESEEPQGEQPDHAAGREDSGAGSQEEARHAGAGREEPHGIDQHGDGAGEGAAAGRGARDPQPTGEAGPVEEGLTAGVDAPANPQEPPTGAAGLPSAMVAGAMCVAAAVAALF